MHSVKNCFPLVTQYSSEIVFGRTNEPVKWMKNSKIRKSVAKELSTAGFVWLTLRKKTRKTPDSCCQFQCRKGILMYFEVGHKVRYYYYYYIFCQENASSLQEIAFEIIEGKSSVVRNINKEQTILEEIFFLLKNYCTHMISNPLKSSLGSCLGMFRTGIKYDGRQHFLQLASCSQCKRAKGQRVWKYCIGTL